MRFIGISLILSSISFTLNATPLYRDKTGIVASEQLTPAQKQQLYDIENKDYEQKKSFIESVVLERYIEEQAKKTSKPKLEIQNKLLTIKEVTDADAKKWFKANPDKIPQQLTFEQVKNDIKKFIKQEQFLKTREAAVKKVFVEKKVTLSLKKPVAPVIKINTNNAPVTGNKNSKIRLIEFADYSCPHCAAAQKVMLNLLKKHRNKFNFTYLDFPVHSSSKIISQGAACAKNQGKFWEYHDLAFAQQNKLNDKWPAATAKNLKMDIKEFDTCMNSQLSKDIVNSYKNEGVRVGVRGTPTIFLNGKRLDSHSEKDLEKAILEAVKM